MADKSRESRRLPRVRVAYEYYMTFKGHTYTGLTREISAYGAGLVSEVALELGDIVELSVIIPDSSFKMLVKGVVRSCIDNPESSGDSDRFIVGVEFTEADDKGLPLITGQEKGASVSPSHTITIDAPARLCYEAVCDFDSYFEWSGNLEKVEVLERHPDGRGKLVDFVYSFFIRKAHYVLEYSYDDEEMIVSWVKAGGDEDVLEIGGSFSFQAREQNQTSATYEVSIKVSFDPSKRLTNWGTSVLMRKELKNFKKFVERRNLQRPE
jgi:uncharacterized membrane protein